MRLIRPVTAAATSAGALCSALLIMGAVVVSARSAETAPARAPVRLAENTPSDNSVKALNGEKIDIDEARRLFEEHQKELERVEREKSGLESETKKIGRAHV